MRLDHTNPDSIARCTRYVASVLTGLRANLQRDAARYNRVSPHTGDAMSLDTTVADGASGLDVRLVANEDGEIWFATGDVQYDTVHGVACGAIELNPNDEDDAISDMATELVTEVCEGLIDAA